MHEYYVQFFNQDELVDHCVVEAESEALAVCAASKKRQIRGWTELGNGYNVRVELLKNWKSLPQGLNRDVTEEERIANEIVSSIMQQGKKFEQFWVDSIPHEFTTLPDDRLVFELTKLGLINALRNLKYLDIYAE